MRKYWVLLALLWTSPVHAIDDYFATAEFTFEDLTGYPFDSVVFCIWKAKGDTASNGQDSATTFTSTGSAADRPRPSILGHLGSDSAVWTMRFDADDFNDTYLPSGMAIAFPKAVSGIEPVREDLVFNLTPDTARGHVQRSDLRTWLASAPNALQTGRVEGDVRTWLGSAPLGLQSGRVDAFLGAAGTDVLTGINFDDPYYTAMADTIDARLSATHGATGWVTATGFSTHNPAAVYAEFISGSNEDAFKAYTNGWTPLHNNDTLITNVERWLRTVPLTMTSQRVRVNVEQMTANVLTAAALHGDAAREMADTSYAVFTESSNEDVFKADVSALALQSEVLGVLDSVGAVLDSLYGYDEAGRFQQLIALMDDSIFLMQGDVRLSVIRWGGVPSGYDSTLTTYFPPSGTANKDSAYVQAWTGGSPTLFYREKYHHINVVTVADSLRGKPATGPAL